MNELAALGKFKGGLGRAAFLRGTSDIAQRFTNRLIPYVRSVAADPWFADRLMRALRTELAQRPRKLKPQFGNLLPGVTS